MDKIDLEELERLHKAATPGPWTLEKNHTAYDAWGESVFSTEQTHNLDNNLAYIVAACNAVPLLSARVRELERDRELYRERLHESWNQTEYCIDLLHDAGVNLTMWACGVESCQQCDVPECDMGDLDMVEKYTSRKAMEQAAEEAGE